MAPSLKNLAQRSKVKTPVVKSQRATKSKTILPSLSSEFIQDSDSEEVESDEESSSNDEPDSSKSATTKPTTNGKSVAPAATSSDSSESESGSGSDDSSESEEGEDEVEEVAQPAAKHVSIVPNKDSASAKASTKEAEPKSIVSKNFKPPHGFEIASLGANSNAAQLFKKSNLEGKQLWYITAPASVPLAKIQQMSLRDVKKGKSVLSYKRYDYGFSKDSIEDSSHTKVMVPNKERDGLRIVEKQVDQILHLKQLVKLPGVSSTSSVSSEKATVPFKRPPRQQPKGLKMRFRPLGFGEGKTGKIGSSSSEEGSSSDSEDHDAPRKFRKPSPIELIEPAKTIPADTSDDSSSDSESDEEMTEAPSPPILPPKASKVTSSTNQDTNGSRKRKHKDGEEKQSKSSSSKSTTTTDKSKLRPEKKKQTESRKSRAEQLLSTEARTSTSYIPPPILPPRLSTPSLRRESTAKPEKGGELSQSSIEKKKRKRSVEKDGATDDAEEPPKKVKKLKRNLGPAWHQS